MSATGFETEDGMEIFHSAVHAALAKYISDRMIDMVREPQSRWNAALIYIYHEVFKGKDILKANNYDGNNLLHGNMSNNNAYDLEKVNEVCDIYISLCYEFDKEISILGFCKMTGIVQDTIYQWGAGTSRASSSASEIYKKLNQEREESLSNMLSSGRRNPVGVLAILNHAYSWNMPGVKEQAPKKALSAADLPQLGTGKIVQIAQNEDDGKN